MCTAATLAIPYNSLSHNFRNNQPLIKKVDCIWNHQSKWVQTHLYYIKLYTGLSILAAWLN